LFEVATNGILKTAPINKNLETQKKRTIAYPITPSITGVNRNKNQDQANTPVEKREVPFTIEDLTTAWNDFTKSINDNRGLQNILYNVAYSLENHNCIHVIVVNQILKEEILHIQDRMLDFIGKKLNNNTITMTIDIVENKTANGKFLTREEKYKQMLDKSKSFALLVKKFGLELE